MGTGRTWPLIGRDDEREVLTAALLSGTGVVVRGPAGVGKTRLVDDVLAAVEADAVPVHRVTGIPGLADAPLGALVPLIGPAYGAEASHRLAELLTSDSGARAVLAIDDAHLLDRVSAGLVHQVGVAGWATLVLTFRSGEALAPTLEGLWSSVDLRSMDLQPLPPERMAELIAAALDAPVEDGTRTALTRAAGGNVLYLRELLAGSQTAGVLVADDGVWRLQGELVGSPALRDIVAARLAALDLEARETVELLAVAGGVPLTLLANVADPTVLERLEREGLVRVLGDGTIDLAHPLHGEIVRRDLPALARLRISRLLVQAAVSTAEIPEGYELRVARWLAEADPTSAGVPATLLEDLAHRAVAVGDTRLAATLAEAAFDIGDSVAPALLASWCRCEQGDHTGAETVLARAAERAASSDVDPVERATLMLEWSSARWWATQDTASATGLLDEVRAGGGDGAALVTAQLAIFEALDGQVTQAIHRATPLVAHPIDIVAAVAAAALAPALTAADRPAEARAVATAGFERAMAVDGILPGNPGVHLVSQILAAAADGAVADAEAFAALVRAGAAGQPSRQARAWATMMTGQVALLAGRLGEAFDLSMQSDVLWRDSGIPGVARWAGAHAALAAAERGDLETLDAMLARHADTKAEGFRLFEPRWYQARAWAAWLRGRRVDAIASLTAGADLATSAGAVMPALESLHLLARWGVAPEAASMLERADELPLQSRLSKARRTHLHAVATGSAAELETVAEQFTAFGTRVLAAEAWAEAAKVHRSAGRVKPAERAAARSAAVIAELAATDRPSTPALVVGRHQRGLSRREAQVARLAAGGHTNKAIAAELVVSERTVENHLYRVFSKLGVSSRRELADTLED
jgi:DNA-binding CsgD family transcriptional regulator